MKKPKENGKSWNPEIQAAFEKDLEYIRLLIDRYGPVNKLAKSAGIDGSAISRLYPKEAGKERTIPRFDIMYKILYTLAAGPPLNLEPTKGEKASKILTAIRMLLEELED